MRIFKNIFLLLTGLLIITQSLSAQSVLTGVVRDKDTGEPVYGATVTVQNANARTLTGGMVGSNGEYSVRIPNESNLTIVFSFVGYESKSVAYNGQSTINIDIEQDRSSTSIETIVISGEREETNQLGLTKRQEVGSSQKVSLANLESAPVTSLAEALQGALSNVDILTGGDPGSNSSIRIRGTSSINANQNPLIVLDGIPFPVDLEDNSIDFSTATAEDYGELLNISPADLESVEVLKDAAATAIYGSRGANGVLLITSKKGQRGGIQININSKNEWKREASTIPLLNSKQYISLFQDGIWNTVNTLGYSNSEAKSYLNLLYDTKELAYDPAWAYFDEYNQDVKWVDYVTQDAYTFDNTLSLSGGGEKTTYRLSFGYLTEQGTTIGTGFNRFSTTFDLQYRFSNKLDISTVIAFTRGVRDNSWSRDKLKSPRGEAMFKMPNQSPYWIDDATGLMTSEYFTPYENFQGNFSDQRHNPVALVHEAENKNIANSTRISFTLHYNILSGLDYYGMLGLNLNNTRTRTFVPQSVTGVTWLDEYYNRSSDATSDKQYLYTEHKFIYRKQFNDNHNIVATGLFKAEDQVSGSYSSTISGVSSSEITDPSLTTGGNPREMKSGESVVRNMSGILNLHYTLFNNYMLMGSYRMEGTSSMGKDSRWKGFGTLAFAWVFSDEPFMKNIHWMDMGKLRGSWGQVGNPPTGASPYIGTFGSEGQYIYDPAVGPSRIQLDNLKYETIDKFNAALDFELFENKLDLTFELYKNITSNLLHKKVKVPSTTGYSEVAFYNSGKMTNQGWELTFSYTPISQSKGWRVNFGFNVSQNFNKVNELPGNKIEEDYSFKNGDYANKVVIGDPLGSFYGYRYNGVYQNTEDTYMRDERGQVVNGINGEPIIMQNGSGGSAVQVFPGDAKYEDVNKDGRIDQYDIVYLGDSNPSVTAGLNFNIRYKNWTLLGNFQGRFGQDVINSARMDLESMYGKGNQAVSTLRRWRNSGDDTDIPRALYNYGYNYLGSDRYVERASFVRLKYITLRYSFPREWMESIHVKSLDLWFTAYDLWTITNYTGQDPEVSLSGGIYQLAKDGSSTPKPVRLAAGLTLKF